MLRFLISFYLFVLALSTVSAADTPSEEAQQVKERWFQIELIVFARTDKSGLNFENWPDDAEVPNVSNAIDFLSPPTSIKNAGKQQRSATQSANIIQRPAAVSDNLAPQNEPQTPADPSLFELKTSELPFIALTSPDYLLTPHARVIKRSRQYRLLRHVTWHQPIFSKTKNIPVRIFGGEDFADRFDDEGYRLYNLSQYHLSSNDDTDSKQQAHQAGENVGSHKMEANITAAVSQSDPSDEAETLPPTGLPEFEPAAHHNWQLDGIFSVYVKRYLHVQFDLAYKLIGQREVDQSQLTSFSDFSFSESDSNNKMAADNPINAQQKKPEPETTLTAHLNWNDADDEDLLNFNDVNKTSKVQLDYLKPYLMHQKRRVRSKEIHYFDHPLFGVIMLITPYDPEPEPESEIDEDPENEATSASKTIR